jgi:hypothetical protein
MSETTEFSLLADCPGAVGDLARAINDSLPSNAPMIALANAFAVASTMRSQRLQCHGIQANSYHVMVALSGSGKTEALKRAELTLQACGFGKCLMGDFTSEAALLCELQDNPHRLLSIDEFGRALQEMTQSQSYRGEALTTIFKIYSCSNSIYRGKSYAPPSSGSARPRIIIEKPQVSILAASTPSAFFEGMNAKVALDGLLGRFFLWFAKHQDPESRIAPAFAVPESVASEADRFLDWPTEAGDIASREMLKTQEIEPHNQKVFDAIWKGVADQFRREPIELKASMLARAAELFSKLCIALTPPSGQISFDSARYAKELLAFLYAQAWTECGELMGSSKFDNEYYVKRSKLLSKLSYDLALSLTEIGERTRRGFRKSERREILDDLIECGEVEKIPDNNDSTGRPKFLYRRILSQKS